MAGEQWDFPNGWAPLQHLVVDTFARFDSREAQDLAFDLAKKWTLGNYKYYEKKEAMLEKVPEKTIGFLQNSHVLTIVSYCIV